ncbi:hypothetical protein, partial [Deinococcus pimensis]|uniref:hypothetical protein n=1 Tax=Deinococcus pimensis TaxID=309888 RepID=UPI001B7F9A74
MTWALRALGLLVATGYALVLILTRNATGSPLYWLDFVTHELGQGLFGIFGVTVLTQLGGSLLQVLAPLGFALGFWLQRRPMLAALTLLWAADARDRALPLLGDDPDAHDWWNILIHWRMVHRTEEVAAFVAALAWPAFLGGVALGVSSLLTSREEDGAPLGGAEPTGEAARLL